MATKFDGLDNEPIITETPEVTTDVTVEPTEVSEQPDQPRTPTDPNKITVRVSDTKAPIILLFGAPSSGKTMTLVRLARYLRAKKGYSVSVDQRFVTTKDVWEYAENSAKFNQMLGTTTALPGTGRNDFLFLRVCDSKGKLICQILEGAGEDYFPSKGTDRAQNPFPSYMTGIFNGNNKKVWVFLTEPNWDVNQADREEYVQRIAYCKGQFFNPKKDKSIILYNKVDKTPFVTGAGQVHVQNAMNECNNEYDGLFRIFRNTNPLPWAEKYTCKFVPFSTGVYGKAAQGELGHYDISHDAYPATLWETIMDCIKG